MERITLIFLLLSNLWIFGNCFICNVPNNWLSGNSRIQRVGVRGGNRRHNTDSLNILRVGATWRTGVFRYKFNKTLTPDDIIEVRKAFIEYETKTCIRFREKRQTDRDYVSIEVDDDVCGLAHVCKMGGYQFARFGGHCRDKSTMIHELGHSLCLGHEHQRADRDNYVSYRGCEVIPPKKAPPHYNAKGIYDYRSIMHYWCDDANRCLGGQPTEPSVQGCGDTPGLSVLDADGVNALYNCQDCHRHRWRPAATLSQEDKDNMHSFGYDDHDDKPLYPCRAAVNGAIVAGKYVDSTKTCFIADGSYSHAVRDNVEVLTIPGGRLDENCSKYRLTKQNRVDVGTAVPVGTFNLHNWTSYVAYGSQKDDDGVKEYSVGKVWAWNGRPFEYPAEIVASSGNFQPDRYRVLTCDWDIPCLNAKNNK